MLGKGQWLRGPFNGASWWWMAPVGRKDANCFWRVVLSFIRYGSCETVKDFGGGRYILDYYEPLLGPLNAALLDHVFVETCKALAVFHYHCLDDFPFPELVRRIVGRRAS